MEVRPATADDVHGIRHVAVEAWHEAYDAVIGQEAVAAVLEQWYDPADLREQVGRSRGHFLVADRLGSVVGYADAGASDGPWGDAQLARIYVDPFHWGEGIGTDLLAAVADRLRADGHERLWLAVLENNEVGVSFYEGHGFEVVAERVASFSGRETPEYVMAADLADLDPTADDARPGEPSGAGS